MLPFYRRRIQQAGRPGRRESTDVAGEGLSEELRSLPAQEACLSTQSCMLCLSTAPTPGWAPAPAPT